MVSSLGACGDTDMLSVGAGVMTMGSTGEPAAADGVGVEPLPPLPWWPPLPSLGVGLSVVEGSASLGAGATGTVPLGCGEVGATWVGDGLVGAALVGAAGGVVTGTGAAGE
jgi:hypothetical protein